MTSSMAVAVRALIAASPSITPRAFAASCVSNASTVLAMATPTRLLVRRSMSLISRSSRSSGRRMPWARRSPRSAGGTVMSSLKNWPGRSTLPVTIPPLPGSPEPARDVVLGDAFLRRREDLPRGAHLHQVAGPVGIHPEERGGLGDPRRLLHVVGHDHDRERGRKLLDQVLDPLGRDRVERRARLVHQDDVRVDGDRPGDAEPLLLAAGEREPRLPAEVVLHLVPERRLLQALLDDLVEAGAVGDAVPARTVGDVLVDGHRERVGALEDETDAAPHLDRLHVRCVDVLAVEQDAPANPRRRDQVVHPVEAAQDRRLAAAGGADEGGHGARGDVHVDVAHGALGPIEDIQVADLDLDLWGRRRVGPGRGRWGKRDGGTSHHRRWVQNRHRVACAPLGAGDIRAAAHADVMWRWRARPRPRAPRLKTRTMTTRTADDVSAIWRTKLPSPSEFSFQM